MFIKDAAIRWGWCLDMLHRSMWEGTAMIQTLWLFTVYFNKK